ncbi:Phospholipid scramblase 2, partial [Schistosoma japonicum]
MWMQRPAVLNCPPGLEHLTQVDQLFIKQKVDVIENTMQNFVRTYISSGCHNTSAQSRSCQF